MRRTLANSSSFSRGFVSTSQLRSEVSVMVNGKFAKNAVCSVVMADDDDALPLLPLLLLPPFVPDGWTAASACDAN